MPPRCDPGLVFPVELTQLIQQQNALMKLLVQNQGNNNNPLPPPLVDNLACFLRLNPPVFSSSIEPIVGDDWLRRIGRELTTTGCTDAEKVCFAAHQLDGPAASWWENYTATFPIANVTWDQFQQAFRTTHVSTRAMSMKKREFATYARETVLWGRTWRSSASYLVMPQMTWPPMPRSRRSLWKG